MTLGRDGAGRAVLHVAIFVEVIAGSARHLVQGGVEDLLERLLVEEDPAFVGPHFVIDGETPDGGRGTRLVAEVTVLWVRQ